MRVLKICLFFLLLIIQHSSAQELHYDQYTTGDGLPSNTIYEIVQDSTGLLWIGTENGLVSFDGTSFERFSDPRLKDHDIIELEISKDGHVTFSNLANQYCRLEKGELVIYDFDFDSFIDLISTKSEDFIICSDQVNLNSIYIFQDNSLLQYVNNYAGILVDSSDEIRIYFLCENKDRPVVKKNVHMECFQGLLSGNSTYRSNSGNKYFMVRAREMWQIDSFLYSSINVDIFMNYLKQGEKEYIATSKGLMVYESGSSSFEFYLQEYKINFAFNDLEGNLWLSTDNSGLLKVLIHDYETLPVIRKGEDIRYIQFAHEKIVTLSYSDLNIYNNDLTLKKSIELDKKRDKHLFLYDNNINTVSVGEILSFGFAGLEENKFTNKYQFKELALSQEKVYFGNTFGFYSIDRDDFLTNWDDSDIVKIDPIARVNAIAVSPSVNYIYVGTDNKLYRVSVELDKIEKEVDFFDSKNIRSLFFDEANVLWVGTSNEGLYALSENGQLDSLNIFDIIGSNTINDIVKFDQYLFVATPQGVVRYDVNKSKYSTLNVYKGLLTNSVRKIFVKSLDSIFISQNSDVIMVDNSIFDKASVTLPLVMKSAYVNGTSYSLDNSVTDFDYNANNLEIKFDYYIDKNSGPKMLEYKFEVDSLWTRSNDLNLRFPSLAPNNYKLNVRGVFSGNEKTQMQTLNFRILPPWWQTTWARVGGLLLLFLLTGGIISYWTRRIKEREESKRKYLEQINQVKDQALQLQMNPHFIFNAMNAIQNFISSDNEESAASYLAKFARLIRMIFEYSKSNLITLEQELEFVTLYVELEKLRFKDKVEVEFNVDDRIEAEKDILNISPLLVQPIIENSFKHGLFHKKGKGLLKVEYTFIDGEIKVIVEDNGIGRQVAMAYKTNEKDGQESSGIKNTSERLEILNFNNDTVANKIEIEDLESDGLPSGTRTTIYIKIKENQA